MKTYPDQIRQGPNPLAYSIRGALVNIDRWTNFTRGFGPADRGNLLQSSPGSSCIIKRRGELLRGPCSVLVLWGRLSAAFYTYVLAASPKGRRGYSFEDPKSSLDFIC